MPKNMKLKLENLKVQSFVTVLNPVESQTIKARAAAVEEVDDYDEAIEKRKKEAEVQAESRIAGTFLFWVCGCIAL